MRNRNLRPTRRDLLPGAALALTLLPLAAAMPLRAARAAEKKLVQLQVIHPEAGTPVPDAVVQLREKPSGRVLDEIATDAEGQVQLRPEVPGRYTVVVSGWGYDTAKQALNLDTAESVAMATIVPVTVLLYPNPDMAD